MKRGMKGLVIIGIIFCILGIGMITAGAMMGGINDLEKLPYLNQMRTSINYGYYNEDIGIIDINDSESVTEYSGIRNLDLKIVAGSYVNIIVEEREDSQDDGIRVIQHEATEMLYDFQVEGDELHIELPDDGNMNPMDFSAGDVTIYIPRGYQFRNIELECLSATIAIEELNCQKLSIENLSGDITIDGGRIKRMEAECLSGRLESFAAVGETAKLECIAGDINISMAETLKQYDYEWEAVAGTIILDGQELGPIHQTRGKQSIDYQAGRKVELECEAGTIIVNYMNGIQDM